MKANLTVRETVLLVAVMAVWCVQAYAQTGGVYDVTQYGALGDGKTINTQTIQAAIDVCAANGGGVVSFPPGKYLTGTIYLKSGVHLRVDQAATLLGSTNLADYPVNYCKFPSRTDNYTVRALIWGEGLEDVGISGTGTLDGQGAAFRGKWADKAEEAKINAVLEKEGRYTVHNHYVDRPYLLRLVSCRRVLVERVMMRNSAMWMQHYLDCDFVTLRGINVYNHASGNNDMVDIDCCRNVTVSDCVGDSDDDALTLKSTGAKPTEHVVITNCILRSHCNALKMGTESAGGFNDITISNCVIQRSQSTETDKQLSGSVDGLAGIALEVVDGGTMERVSISNIVIEGTTTPLFMRLGNRARAGKPSDPLPGVGTLRDVAISNVVATGGGSIGCPFSGIPGHCIENVSLTNISLRLAGGQEAKKCPPDVPEVEDQYPEGKMFGTLPAYGLYFRHMRGLRVRDVRLSYDQADTRPAIVCDDVQGLRLEGAEAQAEPGAATQVLLKDTTDALITGCTAAPVDAFVTETGESGDMRMIGNDLGKVKAERIRQP